MVEASIKKLYYSIGEVSRLTGLKQYVLRYWETEFPILNPSKNRAGNRIYRDKDIKLIFHIKYLLYDQKYTIEGARQQLKNYSLKEEEENKHGNNGQDVSQTYQNEYKRLKEILVEVRSGLKEILTYLKEES